MPTITLTLTEEEADLIALDLLDRDIQSEGSPDWQEWLRPWVADAAGRGQRIAASRIIARSPEAATAVREAREEAQEAAVAKARPETPAPSEPPVRGRG